MKEDNPDVCILLPTLNEEATIAQLVRDFRSEGFDDILVIDGNSTDRTRELAISEGASVVLQEGKGKGQALQQAFDILENDYIIMADGDGTYLASDVHRVFAPLLEDRADHVIGNRFANYEKGAFTRLNRIGNYLINRLFGFAYGEWLNDILSGYRGFTREAIKSFELNKTGFEIESEITIESVKKDMRIAEVPITYLARSEAAATKLNPLRDGFKIGATIYQLAKVHNPMFYFGIIGIMLLIFGILTGAFVVSEWLRGVTRELMTILTAILILSGFQVLIFGFMSDLIVSLHRDTIRTIRRIEKNKK